jgi:hypothetical protein
MRFNVVLGGLPPCDVSQLDPTPKKQEMGLIDIFEINI